MIIRPIIDAVQPHSCLGYILTILQLNEATGITLFWRYPQNIRHGWLECRCTIGYRCKAAKIHFGFATADITRRCVLVGAVAVLTVHKDDLCAIRKTGAKGQRLVHRQHIPAGIQIALPIILRKYRTA